MNFTFATPYLLLLLLLIPCFFWCKIHIKQFYFSKIEWISKESSLLSFEPWIKVLLFSLMVIALAEPLSYDSSKNLHKKGRDLILAIDASGSMAQSGFDSQDRFKSKYETTLKLSEDFIKNRYDDNMGVVIFGTFAYTASPLTYDLKSLNYLLQLTTVAIAGESTAIGDAIMQSIRTLSFGEAKQKAIILLTDGYHNAGRNSPQKAVEKAKELGIKIYTIGVGKKSDYDVALLEKISKETNAKSFSASTTDELKSIYKNISKLEPSPIRSENYLNQKLLIEYPLFIVFLLLFGWVVYQKRELL
jgi:Ca-activated chloride channel family protein